MLEDNQTIAQYKSANIFIWLSMAFQGGFLNIGGLLACHRFVSHVTGDATSIGHAIGEFNFRQSVNFALVPLCFLLGAIFSALLVDSRLLKRKEPHYYVTFGLMSALLGLITTLGMNGFFGKFGGPSFSVGHLALLTTLAFVCGLQNGTITSVSKTVIRTTHLSGILTDLGLGIVRLCCRLPKDKSSDELRANATRVGIITSFISGAAVGAQAFMKFSFLGFAGPCFISGSLFLAMIYRRYSRTLKSN